MIPIIVFIILAMLVLCMNVGRTQKVLHLNKVTPRYVDTDVVTDPEAQGVRYCQALGFNPPVGEDGGIRLTKARLEKAYIQFKDKYRVPGKPWETFVKFADEIGTGDAGSLPTTLQPRMPDLENKILSFLPRIGRRQIKTLTFTWNPITATQDPAYAAENAAQANTAAPTVAYQTTTMKYLYLQHTYSDIMAAMKNGDYDPIRDMMQAATDKMMYYTEYSALLGSGAGANPTGMNTLLDAASPSVVAGGTITLQDIRDLRTEIAVNGFFPDLGLMDNYTYQDFYEQLSPYLQVDKATNIPGDPYGPAGVHYMGINFYPCHALDGLTSTNRVAFLFTSNMLELVELLGLTMENIGKGESVDGNIYRWKWYHHIRDMSASDGTNHDGSGGLAHGKITSIT
jgi:hypothetical protein